MATASDMLKYVGQSGNYAATKGMVVNVDVINVRDRYGDIDLLIRPVSGYGMIWVRAYNVTLTDV